MRNQSRWGNSYVKSKYFAREIIAKSINLVGVNQCEIKYFVGEIICEINIPGGVNHFEINRPYRRNHLQGQLGNQ